MADVDGGGGRSGGSSGSDGNAPGGYNPSKSKNAAAAAASDDDDAASAGLEPLLTVLGGIGCGAFLVTTSVFIAMRLRCGIAEILFLRSIRLKFDISLTFSVTQVQTWFRRERD